MAPEAETDPRAVRVQVTGKDLPTESLVRAYLPQVPHFFVASARPISRAMAHRNDIIASKIIRLLPVMKILNCLSKTSFQSSSLHAIADSAFSGARPHMKAAVHACRQH